MNKEKKTAVALYAAIGLVVIASLAFLLRPQGVAGATATITVDGKIIREIGLDSAADEVFSLESTGGVNITFEIKEHAIRFHASDCPDKICVNAGFLSRDMDIASCLPNKTVLAVSVAD